jgi:hypothetical protein
MLLLESKQILESVSRSLVRHVLPKLEDDFARVQIASAVKALQEVVDRLDNGDPCESLNAAIESDARELASNIATDSPAFAQRLRKAVDSVAEIEVARDRNRVLGNALWELVAQSDDPAAPKLLDLLREHALASSSADNVYLCGEAIASLT